MSRLEHASQTGTWSLKMATALGVYVALGGLLSFSGWAADVPRLTDWFNNGISIQPNAALAVASAGVGLLALAAGFRQLSAAFGMLVTVIGASVVVQWVSGIDLGIDTLLMFDRSWGRATVLSPGRMGPSGATSWTLIGCALVLASLSPPKRKGAPTLLLIAVTLSTLSLVGYMYGASALYTIPNITAIAFQTATFVFAVSIGILLLLSDQGPMRLLGDDGPAGVMVRRIIPGVVVVPVVLGLLRLVGEQRGLYDLAFGTAARTVLEIVLLLALLWWTAQAVSRQAEARKEAEHIAAGRTRQLRTTLESITDGFVTTDSGWRFTYVNPAAQRLLGHPAEDLLGRPIWDLFPETLNTKVEYALRHVVAQNESVKFESFSERLNRWFSSNAYPTTGGGVTIYFQDITEKRTAEEEISASRRQLEADLADTRVLHKLSSEIVGHNDAPALYEKLVEAAVHVSRAQLGSLQVIEVDAASGTEGLRLLASQGFSEQAAQAWRWVNPASQSVCSRAMRTRDRSIVEDVLDCDFIAGSADLALLLELDVRSVQSTPLLSRNGSLLGVISTHWRQPHTPSERELRLLDLLARQAADFLERRGNEESLKDADRRKDEFLVTLAHELRNPLAAVRSTVELLNRKNSDDEELVRARQVLDRHTSLMVRLIDDLMDVGRVARDRLELRLQRVDLVSIVRSAVEMSAPLIERLRHTVQVEWPTDPLIVHGDPDRLGQVVGNLINNACRYTDPGGHIQISAARDGSDAVVTVRDNGIGIPPKSLSSIFEIFSQVDSSFERSQGGLGIGLHLARRLIEMHGGRIRVKSEGPGHGSVFTIWCPVVDGVTATDEPASPARIASSLPRRVLVVDDNVDGAEMLATLLRLHHQETFVAHDGEAALAAAESFRPDAVLLDIGLPLINGVDVCRRIREQPWGREMVVVAVTGWGQDADRNRSRAAGFDHHLVKPVDHNVVLEILDSIPARTVSKV
ncbi:MAG: response regulator [Acidobacteria bacterium]|nr:response regulator [Acidobacteriota bacterium]